MKQFLPTFLFSSLLVLSLSACQFRYAEPASADNDSVAVVKTDTIEADSPLVLDKGTVFYGIVVDGKPADGTLLYQDGSEYRGTLDADLKPIDGSIYDASGTLKGSFVKGEWSEY